MKLRRVLYICAVNLLIVAGLLVAVEGFSSLYLA